MKVYSAVIPVFISLFFIILLLNFLPMPTGLALVKENGVIESFSAIGYFTGAVVAVFIAVRMQWQTGFSVGTFMILFGLRELDFHARFTTMGIFKTKFYLSSQVGVTEKSIVTLIVVLLIAFIFRFLKNHVGGFINDFKKGIPHIVTASAGLLCLPICKILDGGFRWLDDMGQGYRLAFIEESIELAIPYLFIIAMLQFYRSTGNDGAKDRSAKLGKIWKIDGHLPGHRSSIGPREPISRHKPRSPDRLG